MIQVELPVNFVNPTTLNNILRNVSLHLPEGHELIVGTQAENVHLYYDLLVITVTVVGNIHCIKVIINLPLKTANRSFALYKKLSCQREYLKINMLSTLLNFLTFA
jgi:hypothetical protein